MAYIPTTKELRRELYNLQRRLARVEKGAQSGRLSTLALDKYKEAVAKGTIRNDIRNLTPKERKAMYNDIKYISNLKSSTVKGAKTRMKYWEEDVGKTYDTFSDVEKKTFNEMVDKILELMGDAFKYDVQRVVAEEVDKGRLSTEEQKAELLKNTTELYRQATIMSGGDNDEEIRKSMLKIASDELDKLFQSDEPLLDIN